MELTDIGLLLVAGNSRHSMNDRIDYLPNEFVSHRVGEELGSVLCCDGCSLCLELSFSSAAALTSLRALAVAHRCAIAAMRTGPF